jgi:hypothetical protein
MLEGKDETKVGGVIIKVVFTDTTGHRIIYYYYLNKYHLWLSNEKR